MTNELVRLWNLFSAPHRQHIWIAGLPRLFGSSREEFVANVKHYRLTQFIDTYESDMCVGTMLVVLFILTQTGDKITDRMRALLDSLDSQDIFNVVERAIDLNKSIEL